MFDASHYCSLLDTHVTIHGAARQHTHFSDPHNIALGLSTDGFAPFKHSRQTVWPIIIYNYNLPPEERFHKDNIICFAVVLSPKKPQDFNSFLWPLLEELLQLEAGVKTFNVLDSVLFILHAYLILVGGDIPAISMLMRMKGHNGLCPCWMCSIRGVRIPESRNHCHYVPLDRSQFLPSVDPFFIARYDPAHLPLRSHQEMLEQAFLVESYPTKTGQEKLAKFFGIKKVPLISSLSSIALPISFLYDFMHPLWENVIPNLIHLWTGEFSSISGEGTQEYQLERNIWAAIGEATQASGSTIPSQYGARPRNIENERHVYTADMWSFWTLYIGPVVLYRRFKAHKYYDHFVQLVKVLHKCMSFDMSADDVEMVHAELIQWVQVYEKFYYQYSPECVSTCLLTVHALLHIAESILTMGPIWAYWAFPMERFCGVLSCHISNRRFPYANIDSYVAASARLAQVSLMFNLSHELSLKPSLCSTTPSQFTHSKYPLHVLLPPLTSHSKMSQDSQLMTRIAKCLATRYDTSTTLTLKWLRHADSKITGYGGVQRLGGGDIMKAAPSIPGLSDCRDSTHVRYELLVDRYASQQRRQPHFELKAHYGQLIHILLVQLPAVTIRSDTQEKIFKVKTLFLANIHPCLVDAQHPSLDIQFFSSMATYCKVVDIKTVQCLVARPTLHQHFTQFA